MPNNYNLSEGSLQVIMKGGEFPTPVMQVLGSKKINSGAADKERIRMLLSDGRHTISFAMLTTQINDKIGPSGIPTFSVIQLDKYITSIVNNSEKGGTRVLLIMDMHILNAGEEVGERIGSPTPLTDIGTCTSTPKTDSTSSKVNGIPLSKPSTNDNASMAMDTSDGSLVGQPAHPISSLSPYHNKWIIKARVTNKSAIRSWSNSKGEGKLFSMDLVDESGEIRLTGFKDMVDKYYDYIQVDKVYYITKCILKPANKQYSTLKNDYEMTMTADTIIQECTDDDESTIPKTQYDFIGIDKISQVEVNSLIDVVGIVKNVGDLQTLQARSTGRELKKRDVVLVDQSKTAITLTLWGNDAENFDGINNPVVVLKSVRVGEFGGGKNLSTTASTSVKINPELKESYRLRGWYDSEGHNFDAPNISARQGVGNFNTPWMSFMEVQEQKLGNSERGDYYQVVGTVLLVRSENAMYKACPTAECNKKVIDLENGMYRCEKCNREFPNFKYRLLASMNIADWSGNQWISMFSSEVEKVLGMSSEEVGQQVDQNSQAITTITDRAHFKQITMKCRAKMETYNDESRLKTVCVKVDPISYEDYNAHLIERIQQLMD